MNILTTVQRAAVIRCLVDGCSIRATVRITGVAKNTIQKLTKEVGQACLDFQDKALKNLQTKRVQCDEIWCFCYRKEKNMPDSMRGDPGVGSIWTWTAMDADTKLMISVRVVSGLAVFQASRAVIPKHLMHVSFSGRGGQ